MEALFKIILVIHVAGGVLALIGAPIALSVHKGGKAHHIAGKIFLWGMTVLCVTAIYMAVYHTIPLLFMVAFFSYQLVLSGYRSLFYKEHQGGQVVKKMDWAIITVACIVNLALIIWGAWQFLAFQKTIGIPAFIFGLIGLAFARRDFFHFRKGMPDQNAWLFKHFSGMIAGYIAAVTGFLVVNFSHCLPTLVVWLGPTVVGTPLIFYFVAHYKAKLRSGKELSELVTIDPGMGE